MDNKLPVESPPSYEAAATKPARPLRLPIPLQLPLITALAGKRVILASASPRRRQLLAQVGFTNLEIFPCPIPEHAGASINLDASESNGVEEDDETLAKSELIAKSSVTPLSADLGSLSPFEYVIELATRKAVAVYEAAINDTKKGDPALVIAADTVVVSSTGQILEKPRSEAEHLSMLKSLATPRSTNSLGMTSALLAGSALPPSRNKTSGRVCEHKVYTGVVTMAPMSSARDPGYCIEKHVEETTVRFASNISDDVLRAYVRTREGADKAGGYAIQGTGGLLLVEHIEGSFDNVVGLPVRTTLGLIETVLQRAEDDEGLESSDGADASGEDEDTAYSDAQ